MNNQTKQNIGIVLGFILVIIATFMLEPLQNRYFFGILFLDIGILFCGICAYNYKLAKWADKMNDAYEVDNE